MHQKPDVPLIPKALSAAPLRDMSQRVCHLQALCSVVSVHLVNAWVLCSGTLDDLHLRKLE